MAKKTDSVDIFKERVHALEKELSEYRKSEKAMMLSRFTVDQASDSVLWVTADAGIFYVNEAACRNLGYSRHELCSLKIFDINPDFPLHRWAQHWREMAGKRNLILESRHRRKDGSTFPVELMINRITLDGDEYHCTFARDISEKKHAEALLKKSEERFRSLAESTSDWIWEVDKNSVYTYSSPNVTELLGYEPEDVIGKTPFDLMPEDEAECLSNIFRDIARSQKLFKGLLNTILHKDGQAIILETSGVPIFDADDRFVGYRGMDRDVTERMRSEAALKKSEATLKSLLRAAPIGMGLVSYPERTMGWINAHLCRMVGYSQEALIGKSARMIYENDAEYNRVGTDKHAEVKKEGTGSIETRFRRKDGEIIDIFLSSSAIDPDDLSAGLIFTAMDITVRKRAEAALRKNEARYRAVIEDMPALICRFLPNGTLTFVNQNYCKYFNRSPDKLIGQNFFQFIPEDDKKTVGEKFRALNRENPMTTYEHNVVMPDGTIRWQQWTGRALFDEQGFVMEYQSLGRDITDIKNATEEREKIEIQLQQAKRFEAIGTLSGGIAHDFNNLMMGIQGNVSLMLFEAETDHSHREKLRTIERYVNDGADLTRQLLGFARGGQCEITPTDLNVLIETGSRMFGRTKKEIRVHNKYQADLWSVEVDRSQIEQVMLNLYVNAWQAMPSGGELFLETRNVDLDDRYTRPYGLSAGEYVKVSVTDTGIGMDEAIRQRIFDPFFTTKEKGRGTGLGLASVYGIIKNHKGFINVFSDRKGGTRFDIFLPASRKKPIVETIKEEEILEGEETILLVDDEELVIDVGKQMLEKIGYRVLVAKSGKETLEIFTKDSDRIDMVILDMIMPGMGGAETFDQLKAIHPDIKVLLSSGYSVAGDAEKILQRGCNGFIQKPFKLKDLSQKIREILTPA